MGEHTPRRSSRIREKDQPFQMPSREKVLDEIESSPGKNIDSLRPKKLINNLIVENYSYNNREDLPELSDDEELEQFIVGDDELESPKKRRHYEMEEATSSTKKKRRQKVRIYGSDDEDQLQERRKSQRISRQPKKEQRKYDKKRALDQIFEKEPDLKEVIDSDDAGSFVCEDDVEEFESLDTELEDAAEADTDGINLDEVEGSDVQADGGHGSNSTGGVEKQEVTSTRVADVIYEVNSSDSASRDDTVSRSRVGRGLDHKNLSPVVLGRIQYSSDQSSDVDTPVINISTEEGSGLEQSDARANCELSAIPEGSLAAIAGVAPNDCVKESSAGMESVAPSVGEGGSIVRADSSMVSELKKDDDASDQLGKPNGTDFNAEICVEEVPNCCQNGLLSTVKEEGNAPNDGTAGEDVAGKSTQDVPDNGHILQESVPENNKGVCDGRQRRNGSPVLGNASGHIGNDSSEKTENGEGGPVKCEISRSECLVLSEVVTVRPGKDPSVVTSNENNNDVNISKGDTDSPDTDGAGSDSDSEIKTGRGLRSKLHHRTQLAKVLDSDGDDESDEDSEGEINNSFAQRQRKDKRRSITIESDDDDD